MKALLSGARIMTLAEFVADTPPGKVKVVSRKIGKTDWAALSPAKQAHDQREKEAA